MIVKHSQYGELLRNNIYMYSLHQGRDWKFSEVDKQLGLSDIKYCLKKWHYNGHIENRPKHLFPSNNHFRDSDSWDFCFLQVILQSFVCRSFSFFFFLFLIFFMFMKQNRV